MIYLNSAQYVQDEDGRTVDYDAYVKAHADKYNGEKFQI